MLTISFVAEYFEAMKLTIDNFQAISHAELDFPVGITTITGPNSSGKSSILRALSFFTTNSGKKRHIKHGEKAFSVSVEVDGNVFNWRKTKTSGSFSKNDQTVEKIGVKTPHEFFPDFPLSLDEKGNVLQMSGEWESLFPYDRTDSELFTLFENVFNISDSSVILEEIKGDLRTKKNSRDAFVSHYNSIVPKVNTIEEVDVDNSLGILDGLMKRAKSCLQGCPTFAEVELCEHVDSVIKGNIPESVDFDLSSLDIFNLINDSSLCEKITTFNKSVENLSLSVSDLSLIDSTFNLIGSLAEAEALVSQIEAILDLSKEFFDNSSVPEYPEQLYKDAMITCVDLIGEFENASKEEKCLEKQKEELTNKIKEIKVCPLCESKLQ